MDCVHCGAQLRGAKSTFVGSLAQLLTALPILALTPVALLELGNTLLGGQQGSGVIWIVWFLSVITFTLVLQATGDGKTFPLNGATRIHVPPLEHGGNN